MLSFLIPFVILEIIRPILKISPKMTFHNAIMHPFNSVMLNLTHVHTHTHTHTHTPLGMTNSNSLSKRIVPVTGSLALNLTCSVTLTRLIVCTIHHFHLYFHASTC